MPNRSNGLYKKGQKLDQAGLHYEASNFYIDALQRKSSNSDAILALKVTGQKVLDDYYAVFYQYYTDKNLKKAVYAYLEADNFEKRVNSVGVRLLSADYYEDNYNEIKTIYIHELYESAQKELDNEQFGEAESKLKEIQRLEVIGLNSLVELKSISMTMLREIKLLTRGLIQSSSMHMMISNLLTVRLITIFFT